MTDRRGWGGEGRGRGCTRAHYGPNYAVVLRAGVAPAAIVNAIREHRAPAARGIQLTNIFCIFLINSRA